jgi:CRISPR-associated protein Cmr3
MTRPTLSVRIEPLEPVLFGDNRSAREGERHSVREQDPSPLTVYGAIGARLARRLGARGQRDWTAEAEAALGPFRRDWERGSGDPDVEPDGAELLGFVPCDSGGNPWFPRPLHVPIGETGSQRFPASALRPRDEEKPGPPRILSSLPAGWRPLEPAPGQEDFKELEEELFVDLPFLEEILTGKVNPDRPLGGSVRTRDSFYEPEPRLGLAMDNAANAAKPGALFARPYRRYRRDLATSGAGWRSAGFLAWYRLLGRDGLPGEPWQEVGFLGGDRRRARLRFEWSAPEELDEVRDAVAQGAGSSQGFFLYLLTPAPAPRGGRVTFADRQPVGAALGRTLWASGWSAASREPGPRPLVPLLPAGSVLFFRWEKEETDASKRQRILDAWLASLDPLYRDAGFGRVLPGVWS